MKPLSSTPHLVDQVYDAVLDAICSGDMAPGDAVVQERIAEELQVSRQPVVQALVLLKKQGFIEPQGRKGHRVTQLKAEAARRIYSVRGALDRLAAREAAANPDAGTQLGEVLATGRAIVGSGTIADLIDADVNFHQAIYRLAGNPIIGETAEVHWRHIRRVMGAVLKETSQRDPVWREHAAIAEAIAGGDAERAGALAEAHVTEAARMLTAHLD